MKATPVPESSPMLPNTIAMTFTAVPRSSGMPFTSPVRPRAGVVPGVGRPRRWPPRAAPPGPRGRACPSRSRTSALNAATSSRQVVGGQLGVAAPPPAPPSSLQQRLELRRAAPQHHVCRTSARSAGTSRRRSARPAPRAASAATVRSFSPRFRIVSIIPGMETAAPHRTDTSSGRSAPPNCFPVSASTCFSAASTSSLSPSGYVSSRR